MMKTAALLTVHGAQQRLGMDDADDIVRLALPHRKAAERAGEDLGDDRHRRILGIDHGDHLAMGHDLADLDLLQIEDGMQHRLFLARLLVAGIERNGAAQLRLSGHRDRRGHAPRASRSRP